MGLWADLFKTGIEETGKVVFNGLDELITSKEEKGEQEIKLEEIKALREKAGYDYDIESRKIQLSISEQEYKERDSARKMQIETKSKTPSVLTYIFTTGFFIGILYLANKMNVAEIPTHMTVLYSTIISALVTIMTQIISFYFGSSKGGEDNAEKMATAFNNANSKKE